MSEALSGPEFDELVGKVSERMHRAMKEARMSKADKKFQDLVDVDLNRLLVRVLIEGRLTMDAAREELDRLREMLVSRAASPDAIKNGIVVFDGLAYRLAKVKDDPAALDYPVDRNRPRDLLVTYARALHR